MNNLNKPQHREVVYNSDLSRKNLSIYNLKKQIINDVKNYCRKINNGDLDFCYQDTMNKILFVEFEKDLNNINLIFN